MTTTFPYYLTAIKIILVSYILMTPFGNVHAPIVRVASNVCFISAYVACCVAIAAFVDVVLAALMMLILLIWMQLAGSSIKMKEKEHYYDERKAGDGPAKESIVDAEGKSQQGDVMNMKQQLDVFRLEPAVDEPLSVDEYEPSPFSPAYE